MRSGSRQLRVPGVPALRQHLGHHAGVHVRVLPEVHRGQVEAEHLGAAPGVLQRTPRQPPQAGRGERPLQELQIGQVRLDVRVAALGAAAGGLQPGRHEAQLLAPALVRPGAPATTPAARGTAPGRRRSRPPALRARRDRSAADDADSSRQEGADVGGVAAQHQRPLPLQRGAGDLGGDERVPVSVAADPGAEAEEGRDPEARRRPLLARARAPGIGTPPGPRRGASARTPPGRPAPRRAGWGARCATGGWRPARSPPRADAPRSPPAPAGRPAGRPAPRAAGRRGPGGRARSGGAPRWGVRSGPASPAVDRAAPARRREWPRPGAARRRRRPPRRPPARRPRRGRAAPGTGAAPRPR